MLWTLLFSAFLRVTGTGNYAARMVYVGDFGWFEGGSLNLTWDSHPGNRPFPVNLMIFDHSSYTEWYWDQMFRSTWNDCRSIAPTYDNWTTILTEEPQRRVFPINETGVFVVLVLHCSSALSGRYTVDAEFVNPDGQQLDSREIPALTILLVMIPLFALLFHFWVAYVWIKRRQFQRIHIYLGAIILSYVVFLIFHRMYLYYGQFTGETTTWDTLRLLFEGVYNVILFTILVLCSSGWCILAVDLSWKAVIVSIAGVTAFVTSCFLQLYLVLGTWQAAVFTLQIVSLGVIFSALYINTQQAQQILKAHLMVIRNDGIAPTTTPIYQKFVMYQKILYLIGLAFIAFVMFNIILSMVSAPAWAVWFVNNLVQLGIIGMMLWLYRPRGTAVDRFMQPDAPPDGEQRGEVLLEDLNGFALDGEQGGMREWEDGMELPLQPILVSSKEKKKRNEEEPMYGQITTEHEADEA
jgi:hypothetical protein